jgi:hypothetical protein
MANRCKNKKYHYLYKTINLINNKYYYGMHSTNNINDKYLGSGRVIKRALKKYGKENFVKEILEFFDNRQQLAEAEKNKITKEMIQDKYCYNCMYGGEYFNTVGMVTVKDKDCNYFNVVNDDPRYLSGELVGVTKNYFNVYDENNKIIKICKTDQKYLSGQFKAITTGKITVKDKNGNTLYVDINDERYLSGELMAINKNKVTVKDKNGNTYHVDINDERYLSGELKHLWYGRKHKTESKDKISKSMQTKQQGEKNSQYGTCWITKDNENKKIKKINLEQFINEGWSKGRNIKNIIV